MNKEFPEEDEIVLCTVEQILRDSIFVNLEGYNLRGVIPISEIAPGRIRNIRDFVKEKKRIVCKILKIESDKRHITLSLRRVTVRARKEKLDAFEKEKNAETIIKIFSEKSAVEISDNTLEALRAKYGSLFNYLQKLQEDESKIEELNVSKSKSKALLTLIKERVKEKRFTVRIELELKSNLPDAIDKIKEVLKTDGIIVKYISAPFYMLELEGADYKEVNATLQSAAEKIVKKFSKYGEAKIIEKK